MIRCKNEFDKGIQESTKFKISPANVDESPKVHKFMVILVLYINAVFSV